MLRIARHLRSIHTSSRARSDSLFTHRDTPYNSPLPLFEFSPSNAKKAQEIISHYPEQYKKAAIIPLLDLGQRQNKGWTSIAVMNAVAKMVGVPQMRVYEVATFYTMFLREPVGTHVIQVCTTTPCMLNRAYPILDTVKSHLGIEVGQTTQDGKFTLLEVECLGACSNAPMMQINDDFYEDLTEKTTVDVLTELAETGKAKPGPRSGRHTSENSAGLTHLTSEPYSTQHNLPEFQ